MKRVIASLIFVVGSGCLSTVDDRWCDVARPCTAGFVCTREGHCVLPGALDGGTGGGSGGGSGGGGSGGGSAGGGSGGGSGGGAGGGGSACGPMSCASGCCLSNSCVPPMFQGHDVCGFGGQVCGRCSMAEGCVGGSCVPVITFDAGMGNRPIGAPCEQDSQCGDDGLSFCIPGTSGGQPTDFVDGYCSRTCDQEPCPQSATCVEAETSGGGSINICLAECGTCRMGYQCEQQGGSFGVCLPL